MTEEKPIFDTRIAPAFARIKNYAARESRAQKQLAADAYARIPDRHVRRGIGFVTATSALSVPVAAQATDEASDIMCSSGLGNVITLGFGMITLGLLLLAAFRGAMAWQKMGSARSDKKKEGREGGIGAAITFVGAWFFPIFAVVLDKAGVSTLSCVDFANMM